jgi:zinc transporter 2
LTPVFSKTPSRHSSFSLHSDKQKVEHVLNAAQIILKKQQTRQRQRISSDGDLQVRLSPGRKDTSNYSQLKDEGEETSGHRNINIRAAIIHVIGDFIQSIGVLVAAIIIKFYPQLKYFDPICTFFFSIIVLITTVRIFKDSITILLEAVPPNVHLERLSEELAGIQGVRSVHKLHVWSLTNDWNIMSCHMIVDPVISDTNDILIAAKMIARSGFQIKTTTIQLENIYSEQFSFDD